MADVLRLATTDQATIVNLLSGTLQYTRGSFQPRTPDASLKPLAEVLTVGGEGSTANLLSAEAEIQELLENARLFREDPLHDLATWLEWNTDGESAKRAYIHEGRFQINQPKQSAGGFLNAGLFGQLALIRSPFWENITAETVSTSSVSLNGGVWTLSGESAYSGNYPARIGVAHFDLNSTNKIGSLWAGIRSVRGGIADFESVWQLVSGMGLVDTSYQTDANAVGGSAQECTFSTTATEALRVYPELGVVAPTADYDHFIGTYLILGRFRCETSTQAWVRIATGFNEGIRYGPRVVVEASTDYRLYDLGVISIPSGPYRYGMVSHYDLSDFRIDIYAERLSGSGSLWLDELILIPTDHFFKSVSARDSVLEAYTFTDPDDHVWADMVDVLYEAACEVSPFNWAFPTDPGFMVIAGARSTDHQDTWTTDISLDYYPRWRLYRGT